MVAFRWGAAEERAGRRRRRGAAPHIATWLRTCHDNGVAFVNIGPVREDVAGLANAAWLTPRPNTDTAVMLGMAHTLIAEGLHDASVPRRAMPRGSSKLRTVCDGRAATAWPRDADVGRPDICGPSGGRDSRAWRGAWRAGRTMLTAAWSLQRGDHGEQPYWMLMTLGGDAGADRFDTRRRVRLRVWRGVERGQRRAQDRGAACDRPARARSTGSSRYRADRRHAAEPGRGDRLQRAEGDATRIRG